MILVVCPHCNGTVLVEQLNCQIFRHGILKETGQQINPHLKKSDCDLLFESGRIYGCGKPFKVVPKADTYEAIVCDYI
jgi:hypothetical protein